VCMQYVLVYNINLAHGVSEAVYKKWVTERQMVSCHQLTPCACARVTCVCIVSGFEEMRPYSLLNPRGPQTDTFPSSILTDLRLCQQSVRIQERKVSAACVSTAKLIYVNCFNSSWQTFVGFCQLFCVACVHYVQTTYDLRPKQEGTPCISSHLCKQPAR
jgi:hypothetical protein